MPHSTYQRQKNGSAVITPSTRVIAGSAASFNLIYTAGYFGIDDTGSIKIVQRYASDMAKPQFDDPAATNYVSVEASNGAVLDARFDVKQNIRPWGKTLYIKIVKGYLREGDKIIVRYGDPRNGCPGIRMQTFCEKTFEFKVLVDAFATCDYVELPESPVLEIIPGDAVKWFAVLPTLRRIGEPFRLSLKAEDAWGNPVPGSDQVIRLKANHPVKNLPDAIQLKPGQFAVEIENLIIEDECELAVEMADVSGKYLGQSNPLRIAKSASLLPFWADLHGQSEETIGTNSVRDYFEFGRNRAFLDALCHQGNDFQITNAFWTELQSVTREFNEPGRFIAFPGYEWSGNTALGGDHNVIFLNEGEQIHRSSHALISDLTDGYTDRHTSKELFETLRGRQVFVYAHVGGRYADLNLTKDIDLQYAVEIHSAWGTFEWLLHDAFSVGKCVGVVANSDGHKGRPGVSYPGASLFGSYGGLTCFLATELTREAIFESLLRRHHFATTGCRMLLDTKIVQPDGTQTAMMGDIFDTNDENVLLCIEALCSAPIERIDIFNGTNLVETCRTYGAGDLGRRIRVTWEGAEYRGRGRETCWDGSVELNGNIFESATSINFWNPENPLEQESVSRLSWKSLTTGGFSGFEAILKESGGGTLTLHTPLMSKVIELAAIGFEDLIFEAGGLGRRIRMFRLPNANHVRKINLNRKIRLNRHQRNPLYIRVIQEDGHTGWSSPIYVNRS
ncbi:DUF3604 domain-containing protein [candidate division KSB1 bacterium]|nr:DUF3604 domain-containing protein [candidate division KSB1 bacterium]